MEDELARKKGAKVEEGVKKNSRSVTLKQKAIPLLVPTGVIEVQRQRRVGSPCLHKVSAPFATPQIGHFIIGITFNR